MIESGLLPSCEKNVHFHTAFPDSDWVLSYTILLLPGFADGHCHHIGNGRDTHSFTILDHIVDDAETTQGHSRNVSKQKN